MSRAEFHASDLHPGAIVERVHALESGAAWRELCGELSALPDAELELFEDEIRDARHRPALECASTLLARIAAHWKRAERVLAESHDPNHVSLLGVARPPSVAVTIVVTRDQIVTGENFPYGQIALTFDDGPHPTRTPRVLEILAEAGIRATFFEIGKNAAQFPEVSRQVFAAGHSVGTHTFSHPDLPQISEPRAEAEIESGEASVIAALGLRSGVLPFFRFPYGAKTLDEQGFVQKRGNATFFWNMDSQDWRIRDPHQLFLHVLGEVDRAQRGILLFHDIHEQTVIVLPHVVEELAARGFSTVVFVSGTRAATPLSLIR